ncbi:hypothetical protein R3I94_017951 [Phoxinus phoxinus]
MASTVPVLLLLSAGLFTVTVGFGDDECSAYITSDREYMPSMSCTNMFVSMHCCGTCDFRYCCPLESLKLSAYEQHVCTIQNSDVIAIVSGIIGIVVFFIIVIVCCCSPCCCMYNMCRKPRPVVGGAQITTVMNTQCVQQQQPAQYPAYQPVPTQPGYGAQPMQTGQYQGNLYTPGPPPSYNMAANPGYPSSQATYTMMPPAQPGSAYPPPETSDQLAYNPAYMQPPKTGY